MTDVPQKILELRQRRTELEKGGGDAEIEKQHKRGKRTARERLLAFFDPGSFVEIDLFARQLGREFGIDRLNLPADGILIGHGKVEGRPVAAFAEDFTVMAGTFGEMHGRKMCKIIEFAMRQGMPIVGFSDSGGARLQENMGPLSQYGKLFYLNSIASGVIPQIAVLLGPVAGGQAYSPGLNDFLFMVRGMAQTFIAGPPLVEAVVGEKISAEELGGVEVHSRVSGVCHRVCESEDEALDATRRLLSYLPSSNREKPPLAPGDDPAERTSERLYEIVPPDDRTRPYDMHEVIDEIVDRGSWFELHRDFAPNCIVGLARFDGRPTGIYANNPSYMGGAIDVKAAEKMARFIRFCDAFGIPLVALIDSPAYQIGSVQEQLGIIYKGAKLLHAISEATVPQISVYIGKAFAGAYLAMGSKDFQIDYVVAWPTASIALVGPKGTVNVVFGKEIAKAADPAEERRKREEEFSRTYMNVYYPASFQHLDDIIDPKDTRPVLCRALEAFENKKMDLPWRKHGNIPL